MIFADSTSALTLRALAFFYTAPMTTEFDPLRFDVQAFALAGASLSATDSLSKYERLTHEGLALEADSDSDVGATVSWSAHGDWREKHGEASQAWLHVTAEASVPLTCQRCLTRMDADLFADRWFRFVADEDTAEAQDDDAEEDLLVTSHTFNLQALVEDELLMSLPMVPVHEVCPVKVKLQVADAGFEEATAAKENPFAALAGLKKSGC